MASPFFFQASSCNLIIGGNLGVGTDTPTSKLTVWGASRIGTTSNTTTQSTNYGQWQNRMEDVSPDQSLTQSYNLLDTYPLALTANRTMLQTYNEYVLSSLGSSTNGARLVAYGVRNNINNGEDYGQGHIYAAYGIFNYIVNKASIASNANTIQTSYGTYNYMRQYRDGVTSNSYGTYNNMVHDAGTFVNSYGCYVATDTTILNSYGIYCTGEQKNYFAGNVGIGTTIPTQALSVNGYMNASIVGFHVVATHGYTATGYANVRIDGNAANGYDSIQVNVGSIWNGSTGVVTAPVAGYYFFSFSVNSYSSGGATKEASLRKNATTVSNGTELARQYHDNPASSFDNIYDGGSAFVYLDVNDTVSLWGINSMFIRNGNYFCGYLVMPA